MLFLVNYKFANYYIQKYKLNIFFIKKITPFYLILIFKFLNLVFDIILIIIFYLYICLFNKSKKLTRFSK